MNYKNFFLLIAISLLLGNCDEGQKSSSDIKNELRSRLDIMESAYQNTENQTIADVYSDDSYLIGPGGIITQGRQGVDDYWKGGSSRQISWTLEDFGVFQSLDELLSSPAYTSLQRKPPLWHDFDITLEEDEEYIYQLGRSTLINENNQERGGSIVNFLLVWKEIEGTYFIFIDSYIGTS